ncbi:conserved unknown protein [Ectocarpus siliculosus]|uniref:Kinesin-like protein n=1 Tax=Ectocarpus siliculosus TaxID=2880 RepID=D7G0I4_ECTSI|nr:conserved unknown protein [Ectocarpus siliculosus]|eukprot:CBJ33013.1 conserved unknown protein [Ectocarpus siliculosus]
MNASLLAALSSPVRGARTPVSNATAVSGKTKRNGPKHTTGAGSTNNKENTTSSSSWMAAAKTAAAVDGSRAPAFTALETPSTPGRMENLRVLIEEGKKAAAEGRLAAALRKYETAMVTLPEAYKPRLRKKIARLEALLDDEEERPRRSSPLARAFTGSRDAMPCVSGTGRCSASPNDQDVGLDMAGLGDKMSASSLLATAASEPYRSPSRPRETAGDHDHARGVSLSEEASPGAGEDGGYCGLGEAGPEEEEEEEQFDGESMDAQERLRAMNRGLSGKLEKQVVDIMNQASSAELTDLHGIGPRRAQLILQTRAAAPFETLADLSRIGMYPKQIEKMGRHNMLECLDVCSPVESSTREEAASAAAAL